jgi:Na+/melibiose symporter-like transporter
VSSLSSARRAADVAAVWRLLTQHRDLRLVLSAGLISLTGDWMLRIGLSYYIYVLTGSTLASAMMLLASFMPQVLLGSIAGVFVDRWDRKRTMVISNLLLAVGLLPLLLVHSADRVWVVYAVLAWEGVVQLFFAPAEQAFLPRLVPDDQLVTANALNGQNSDLSRLIGSALGGVLAATGGITALAIVDAATFLGSALLILLVSTSGRLEPPIVAGSSEVAVGWLTRLFHEWVAGLRMSVSHRVLRLILLFLLVTSMGEGIMGTLFAPFVRDVLHGSGQAYGLIVSVQAVGGIAGGLVAASIGDRVRAIHLFGGGAIAFGIIDLVMFLYPLAFVAVWPAVVCMVLVGLPGALMLAGFMTLFQRNTADAYRGRVYGAIGLVQAVAVIAGTLGAGFLGESVGIVPILAMQGAGYVLAGLAVLMGLRGESEKPTGVAPVKENAPA